MGWRDYQQSVQADKTNKMENSEELNPLNPFSPPLVGKERGPILPSSPTSDLEKIIAQVGRQYGCPSTELAAMQETALIDSDSALITFRVMAEETVFPQEALLCLATELDSLIHEYCWQKLLSERTRSQLLADRKRMAPYLLVGSIRAFRQAIQLEEVR